MKKIILISAICFFSLETFCQVDTMVTNVLNFSWMPDGKAIVFAAVRSDKARKLTPQIGIFKIDLKSGQVVPLIKNGHSPSISPDGKKIAYTKNLGVGFMGNSDIYVFDMKTQTEIPVTSDTLRESSPSWSPDGKKLVYSIMAYMEKGPRFAAMDLWTIELSSRKSKQITETNGSYKNYNPVWSPESSQIVYYLEKGDNRDQIYVTDENGSYHTNLTADTSTHNFYPSWMGKQVIYTKSPNHIGLMNADGTQKTLLEGVEAFWAMYNKKSEQLAFLTPGSRQISSQLKIYDLKTKSISQVVSKEALDNLVF